MTEDSCKRGELTVTDEAVVSLRAGPFILAQPAVAPTVPGTAGRDAGRDLRPLLQI